MNIAARQCHIGSLGRLATTIEVAHHYGIDLRIERLDASDDVIGQLDRGNLSGLRCGNKFFGRVEFKTTSALLLVGLFTLLQSATSRGQEAIGSATSVKPQAEANARTLSGGSAVYSKELIHTGDAGVADLRFHDNSNLSVGPKSSVRLDKFVYDPNKSAGGVAVEATRGSFRFVTGSQSKGSYQVKTPYGTLGIRG